LSDRFLVLTKLLAYVSLALNYYLQKIF